MPLRLRTGAAALTAGQSEKAGRKAFGAALSLGTLGASRLAQRGVQKFREKFKLGNNEKLARQRNKLQEKLGSIGSTYRTAGKGLLRTTKAAATLGGTEIKRAYNKTERGQISKLSRLQNQKIRAKNNIKKSAQIEAKIQKTQGKINARTNKKIAKSQAISKNISNKQTKATDKIKTYRKITKTQRDARNKRTGTREAKTAKKSAEMDALQKQVNQQKINGQKSVNQQAIAQERAKKLMAARRAGKKNSASKILGDDPPNIVQPKKKTRTQRLVSGLKKTGKFFGLDTKKKKTNTLANNKAESKPMSNAEMLMASTSASAAGTNGVAASDAGTNANEGAVASASAAARQAEGLADANAAVANPEGTNANQAANQVVANPAAANPAAANQAALNASQTVQTAAGTSASEVAANPNASE